MILFYEVSFHKVHSLKFGDISPRKTGLFGIPTKTDKFEFLRHKLNSHLVIHYIKRVLKKEIEH